MSPKVINVTEPDDGFARIQNTTEGDIIENSSDDTLYTHETDFGGTYFNVQSNVKNLDEEGSIDVDISAKVKVTLYYVRAKSEIRTVKIKKFKKAKGGKWEEDGEVSFSSGGAGTLKKILELLGEIDLSNISERKLSIGNDIDEETAKQLEKLFISESGSELFQELIDTENLSQGDIIGVGYKKDQLEIFRKLLDDEDFFSEYKNQNSPKSDEGVWQFFFEQNKWIFGYGLNYIWLESVNDGKLERVISGYDFNSSGKRIDGLLSTVSEIKKFVLVEIKRHNVSLIGKQYRGECWVPSEDLYGGISQIQTSSNKFKEKYFQKVGLKDKEGNPVDSIFNTKPKSYLIIGQLKEFQSEGGVNIDKYSSFELYRESIEGIDIITYDELYERARHIIENIKPIKKEDLPF